MKNSAAIVLASACLIAGAAVASFVFIGDAPVPVSHPQVSVRNPGIHEPAAVSEDAAKNARAGDLPAVASGGQPGASTALPAQNHPSADAPLSTGGAPDSFPAPLINFPGKTPTGVSRANIPKPALENTKAIANAPRRNRIPAKPEYLQKMAADADSVTAPDAAQESAAISDPARRTQHAGTKVEPGDAPGHAPLSAQLPGAAETPQPKADPAKIKWPKPFTDEQERYRAQVGAANFDSWVREEALKER